MGQTVKTEQKFAANSFTSGRDHYDVDAPITVYSDAVRSRDNVLKTQIYHSETSGRNPFAKNATFSTPITEFKKDATKI
jgi:hypothetical protein